MKKNRASNPSPLKDGAKHSEAKAEAEAQSAAQSAVEPQSAAEMGKTSLWLVATPIGNLQDITLRAIECLKKVDAILCEDTRVSQTLLAAHGIRAKLMAFHEHNEDAQRPQILRRLQQGETMALITDAGTPLVADPGYKLVRACIEAKIAISALPGANAALLALTLSGLPPDRFFFAGFLPPRKAARTTELKAISEVPGTLIFYETAPRILSMLEDVEAVLGNRQAVVARELTKMFETLVRGKVSALREYFAQNPPRGEIVVLLGAAEEKEASDLEIEAALKQALKNKSVKEAAAAVAVAMRCSRQLVYQLALKLKDET